jgi:hypothetical protein
MCRVIFCNGIGNLSYQSTALLLHQQKIQKNYNILYIITEYNLPKIKRKNCINLAEASGIFKEIHDLGDVIADFHESNLLDKKNSYDIAFKKFQNSLGSRYINEIWVYKLDFCFIQFVLEKFPGAKIIFTDNGLASYRNILIVDKKPQNYNTNCIYKIHLNRLDKIYLTISEMLTLPNYITPTKSIVIGKEWFKKYFSLIMHEMQLDGLANKSQAPFYNGRALVIGSAFYRLGIITKSEENKAYLETIKSLISKKYHVFWKSHPRDDYVNFNTQNSITNLSDNFPIEVYAYLLKFDVVISICSSALFTLKKLFNAEPLWIDINFKNIEKIPKHIKIMRSQFKKYSA